MAKSGDHYAERGRPLPSYLTGAFDELADCELLELAEQDPWGLRQVSFTEVGHARYAQISAPPWRAAPRIPASSSPPRPRLAVPAVSQREAASLVEHASLPVGSPGAHLQRCPLVDVVADGFAGPAGTHEDRRLAVG